MGVTIYFEGQLRGHEQYAALLHEAKAFAIARDWPVREIDEREKTLNRVIDERNVDYIGPVFGIELQPHPNSEPLRLEFDNHLFVQQHCKTQFSGAGAHIEIIRFLREITRLFSSLNVVDEGEYWELSDPSILQSNFDNVDAMLAEILLKDPTARGPIRLETGRIIDVISDR
ncbi:MULTISPECIES: hypothetical protein [unclassified Mesorhizobium]|uniref:hypothetical protein n=1 Tax=unclassified Mesorhizobium TaxID=325217 RepID=UPI00333937FF